MRSDQNTASIYIGLGANLPFGEHSPRETQEAALAALEGEGVHIVSRSAFWTSPAWPDPSKPAYVNAVAEVATDLDPHALLRCLLAVEARFGRVREARWGARTLDLDLIDYAGRRIEDAPELCLPHPRTGQRAFVLLPLKEIAPGWIDPVTGQDIATLIAALPEDDRRVTQKL